MKKIATIGLCLLLLLTVSVTARGDNWGTATSKVTIPNHSNGGGDDTTEEEQKSSGGSGSRCASYEWMTINGQPTPIMCVEKLELDKKGFCWMCGLS